MRKLLFLAVLIFCACHAKAACTAPAPGSNEAATVSAIAACSSSGGGTLNYAAGTYGPFTSNFTLACGVTLSGPVLPYSHTHYQTAIFIGSSSFIGQPLQTTAGCSATQSIQYIEWNGEQPTTGGGGGAFIFVTPGTTNLNINHMWIHGMTAPNSDTYGDQNTQAEGIYFCCSVGDPVTNNVSITWSEFGSESYSDCAQAMLAVQTENGGGFCNGIGLHANTQNLTVQYNNFHYLEQGMKYHESSGGGGYCKNDVFNNNDFFMIQRIPYETQCNLGANPATPTLMYIRYNSFGQRYNGNGGQENYDLSSANGCTNGSSSTCEIHNDYNVDIAPVAYVHTPTHWGQGFEIWGAQNTTASYNFFQGFMDNSITNSLNGAFTENNNFMNNPQGAGVSQNCLVPQGIYWNLEQPTAFNPSCSGNTFSSVGTGTLTSAQPTISLSGATFTLANTGTNRDTNTTIWYTTDGSTPVPGSGTAKAYTAPFTVVSTTTVNAVGMWGAINQPYSYPTNYGYVPSAKVTATYTSGAGSFISPSGSDSNPGTMASPWLTPNHPMTCGQTITALSGAYTNTNFGRGKWGAVTCPSANNVAWLTCQTFDTCKINVSTGSTQGMTIDQSFWGVQGWEITSSPSVVFGTCFNVSPSSTFNVNHVIFANDIANSCAQGGFSAAAKSSTVSVDYITFVGDIAYNSAQGTDVCASNFSVYEPIASDSTAGTHIYMAGNFSYEALDGTSCDGSTAGKTTDGEGFNLDTFDMSQSGGVPYTQQAAIENNIAFLNGGFGYEVENNAAGSTHAPIFIQQNTSYGNSRDPNREFCIDNGDLTLYNAQNVTAENNLIYSGFATNCSTPSPYFAMAVSASGSSDVVDFNYASGVSGNNTYTDGAGGFAYGSHNIIGTNPTFANPVNPGAPSCGSFASVPACMAAVISDYTPTVSAATSYGYQIPSGTSVSDPLYPPWLCSVTLPAGLVTPGCGGSGITLTGGFQSNTGGANTITVGAAGIQQQAFGTFSDSSTHQLPYGGYTATFSSSNGSILGVTSSGLVTGASAGFANSLAVGNPGGITINQYGWTVSASGGIPSTGYLGTLGDVNTAYVGGAGIQFTAYMCYSNITGCNPLPDAYGNTVTAWSIVPGSSTCGTVNSSGVFSPTTVGTCNVKAVSNSGATINQWTMTISNPPSTPAPPQVNVIMISQGGTPR